VKRFLTILKRLLEIGVLVLAIVYVGDYVSVRYRIPKSRDPYGAVPVQRYYAVTQKSGKHEFYFDQPTVQVCVHSLFPHLGYVPCWYLNRRRVQRVDM
jgi:hypothetical protein